MDFILDTRASKTPREVRLAEMLYEEKVLPDNNVRFAKALIKKTFYKKSFSRLLLATVMRSASPGNHNAKTRSLRKAVNQLAGLSAITIHPILYDEETLARIKLAAIRLNEGERILQEVLREIDAHDLQVVEEAKRVLGRSICALKKVVEMENQWRKSRNPRLPIYRNEWKIVVELLKRKLSPDSEIPIYYTPSIQAVRQLAYRYKKRRIRKKTSLKG